MKQEEKNRFLEEVKKLNEKECLDYLKNIEKGFKHINDNLHLSIVIGVITLIVVCLISLFSNNYNVLGGGIFGGIFIIGGYFEYRSNYNDYTWEQDIVKQQLDKIKK